jgi:hypothetical protein
MCISQIRHVHIVAHARAVRCGIAVTENLEAILTAEEHSHYDGNQVGGQREIFAQVT